MFDDGEQREKRGDLDGGPAAVGAVGFDVSSASDAELLDLALLLEQQRVALDAAETRVLAELEARGSSSIEHGLSTAAWLAFAAHLPATVAKARVKVAGSLRRDLALVADALAAGTIGWDHARVITELANPRILDVVVANQEVLLGLADHCRFEQWRAEVQALARLWDEDGGYDPNEDDAANRLSFGATIDGLTTLAATLTRGNGEAVMQAIDARADALFRQATEDHEVCADLIVPSRRTLRALALVELVRQALAIDVDSSTPPRPEVTLVVGADEPTSPSNPDGVRLADGSTRVLQCDVDLQPIVVDSLGVPLDHGRTVRLATDAQRRAVRRRDGGCAFPGCASKAQWCDVHHCVHWHGRGVTDTCNLVCLCRRHHGVVHRRGWRVLLDGDGWAAFRSASGITFWGQRHGRQRAGPPPEPPPELEDEATAGVVVAPGRFHLLEDPLVLADARQRARRRLVAA